MLSLESFQVVTSEPELSITELTDDDDFIILASDGVWDRMTNEAAVQFVRQRWQQPSSPPSVSNFCSSISPRTISLFKIATNGSGQALVLIATLLSRSCQVTD